MPKCIFQGLENAFGHASGLSRPRPKGLILFLLNPSNFKLSFSRLQKRDISLFSRRDIAECIFQALKNAFGHGSGPGALASGLANAAERLAENIWCVIAPSIETVRNAAIAIK